MTDMALHTLLGDERGQVADGGWPMSAALAVVMGILAVYITAGAFRNTSASEFRAASDQIVTACHGVLGCDGFGGVIGIGELLVAIVVFVLILGVVINIVTTDTFQR